MSVQIEVSVGELLDKITILQIKAERIRDVTKLANVNNELAVLNRVWNGFGAGADIGRELAELKAVNESLWEIEDKIRIKEAQGSFDQEFIQLARSVYFTNDRRAEIKRRINEILGSALVEEKSYADYRQKG